LDASVDLEEIARLTKGYSGADLQALVYNAHLQVVHASIDTSSKRSAQEEEEEIRYVTLGATGEQKTLTRAEESAMQKRLQRIMSAKPGDKTEKKPANTPKKYEISQADLLKVLETTRPSVSREELNRLGTIYSAFVSDRSQSKQAFPSLPTASGVGSRATLG